jgi:hypothetical protein
VRTIQIEVRPLGGDSVKLTLDASAPTVADAKTEIVYRVLLQLSRIYTE